MKYTRKIGEKSYITFEEKDIDEIANCNPFIVSLYVILMVLPFILLIALI